MKTIDQISQYLQQYQIKSSTEDFIAIVSNIYHDFESKTYDEKHTSIKHGEKYWKQTTDFVSEYFKNKNNLSFLDFGCGTGFASEQVTNNKNLENKISKIYCYDLSESMVEECKKKFSNNMKFNFYANKSGFAELVKDNATYDIVTCNALLHHILEPDKLLFQFSEVLKKDGILIIGHEPNKAFYKNKALQLVTNTYRYYKKGLNKIGKIIKKTGSESSQDLTTLTYSKLVSQNQITKDFPKQIIPKLVDIHVPMGNLKKQPWGELGFDADFVVKNTHHSFVLLKQISYNHIKDQNAYNSLFWRSISRVLESVYPTNGADTILIFKKV